MNIRRRRNEWGAQKRPFPSKPKVGIFWEEKKAEERNSSGFGRSERDGAEKREEELNELFIEDDMQCTHRSDPFMSLL